MGKKVYLKDIASEAGVSLATVSRVMNGRPGVSLETRDRVMHLLESREVQSRRAPRPQEGMPKLIGFINDSEQYRMDSWYTASLLDGINRRCHAHNYNAVLIEATEIHNEMRNPGQIPILQHVSGLIWSTPVFRSLHHEFVTTRNLPCVVINNVERGVPVHLVESDNLSAAHQAVEFLVGMGHRRIGFIGGDLDIVNIEDRYRGYRSQLEKMGITPDPNWIVSDLSQNDQISAIEGTIRLLGRGNLPTAMICSSLPVARGLYEAFRQRGLTIPDDMSVLAYDDSEDCELLTPSLTTFRQPLGAMSQRAVDLLVEAIHTSDPQLRPYNHSERLSLIVRDSVRHLGPTNLEGTGK